MSGNMRHGKGEKMEVVGKIDMHAHAVPWPGLTVPYGPDGGRKRSVEELFTEYYDALHVEKCVLLTLVSPEAVMDPVTSEMVKFAADQNKDRAFWFCGVDPRAVSNLPSSDLGYLLAHYKALGARGVGEITANLRADDPLLENLFSYCEELEMPATIHLAPKIGGGYGIVDEIGLPRLEGILKRHPKLKILGHSQLFWSEIGDNVTEENRSRYIKGKVQNGRLPRLLREYENLYCDLSAGSGANALLRDREHAARFLEEFSHRVLYGCDICASGAKYPFQLDAFLSDLRRTGEIREETYRNVVRDNAKRILRLV